MIDSIWSKKVPPRYPPLAGDIQAEAAVIGGGMAGVPVSYTHLTLPTILLV